MDGRQDEQIQGAGGGVCDLERCDDVLRPRRQRIRNLSSRIWRSASAKPAAFRPPTRLFPTTFPPGRRGTALGLFNLGPAFGATLGIAFGASIAAAFSWRYAFLFLGSIGLFAAIAVLLFVREPRRGGLDRISHQLAASKTGFWRTLTMFFARPSLRLAAFASGANQFITYGLGNFVVLFLMREKGMALKQIAVYYALVVLIGVGGAMFVSGRLIDRFTRTSKQAYALVPAISLALAVPFYLAFVWAPSWHLALFFLVGTLFLNYFYLSSMVTLVQEEVRPDQRVMSGALLLLVMNFIGLGLGPTYVGAASDFFRRSPSPSLVTDCPLHTRAVLCRGYFTVLKTRARAFTREQYAWELPYEPTSLLASSGAPWSAVLPAVLLRRLYIAPNANTTAASHPMPNAAQL